MPGRCGGRAADTRTRRRRRARAGRRPTQIAGRSLRGGWSRGRWRAHEHRTARRRGRRLASFRVFNAKAQRRRDDPSGRRRHHRPWRRGRLARRSWSGFNRFFEDWFRHAGSDHRFFSFDRGLGDRRLDGGDGLGNRDGFRDLLHDRHIRDVGRAWRARGRRFGFENRVAAPRAWPSSPVAAAAMPASPGAAAREPCPPASCHARRPARRRTRRSTAR